MARRNQEPLNGARYVGNNNLKVVHDLDNEKTNCMIDNFINEGHAVPFDSLKDAFEAGMIKCDHCIAG